MTKNEAPAADIQFIIEGSANILDSNSWRRVHRGYTFTWNDAQEEVGRLAVRNPNSQFRVVTA